MIPIVIGLLIGFLIINNDDNSDQESTHFTKEKLLENSPPIIGDKNAKITILEFGDYQCTFCYKFHQETLNDIKINFIDSGKVNYVYRDFPLNGYDSVLAAEATYCANEQGDYWGYHNILFDNWAGEKTGWINMGSLTEFAAKLGLNIAEFENCLNSHKYYQKVIDNENYAKRIGINATPYFLIFNNEEFIRIIGAQELEVFQNVIDQLITKQP